MYTIFSAYNDGQDLCVDMLLSEKDFIKTLCEYKSINKCVCVINFDEVIYCDDGFNVSNAKIQESPPYTVQSGLVYDNLGTSIAWFDERKIIDIRINYCEFKREDIEMVIKSYLYMIENTIKYDVKDE